MIQFDLCIFFEFSWFNHQLDIHFFESMSHSEPPNVNHHLKKKSVLPKLDDDMYTLTEFFNKKKWVKLVASSQNRWHANTNFGSLVQGSKNKTNM